MPQGGASVPDGSLLREGRAMAVAIAEDFLSAGFRVLMLRDSRLPANALADRPGLHVREVGTAFEERQAYLELVNAADWSLLIAPETDGVLFDRAATAIQAGARLLSPIPEFISIAAEKTQTLQRLCGRGVPVPRGVTLAAAAVLPQDFPYPAVRKPIDGAGSCGVEWIADAKAPPVCYPARLEQYCPGRAASVAMICGSKAIIPLPACAQRLESFAYQGGETPLAPELACRAERLALSALSALPVTTGYVGIDLVLGDAADGSEDVVIEVNPRLTTSYIGLRVACRDNLAMAMVQAAEGRIGRCRFDSRRVVFDADGTWRW